MITIKLPYITEDKDKIKELQRQQSCIIRYAYNKFFEGKTEKEIRLLCKFLNHIELLDSWFIECGILKGKYLYEKDKKLNKRTIFGGYKNFKDLSKGKITKEEYKEKRLLPLCSIGEKLQKGNRKFKFFEDRILFKPNKKTFIELKLPKLRKNYQKQLQRIITETTEKKLTISVELSQDFLYLIFQEETINEIEKQNENRVASIDMNPNYIGFSIVDYSSKSKILFTEVIDISYFTQKLHISSSNNKQKHQVNKQKYELSLIAKRLVLKAKHYNCKYFAMEDLNIKSSNKGKGKNFNRLCNNKWNRNLLREKILKHCNINNIELREVYPHYSSTIGNVLYNYPDMIASSLEIGRRGLYKYVKGKFYPNLIKKENLTNRWKDALNWTFSSWKELHDILKTSKLKYRRSLEEFSFKVFRFNSHKSFIKLYSF